MSELKNRYEFIVLFDVENGNPNGDPDAGNMPRVDIESNLGIVTDVCLKRKIRNYIELTKKGEPRFNILVKADASLNSKFTAIYKENNLETGLKGANKDVTNKARNFACQNFYDVRTFGAVMSTGEDPCGIVRGPVQINFARSVEPIFPQELTITRQAITTDKDFDKKDNEMGKKSVVPYALYKAEGYVQAFLAKQTGFDEEDLELLFDAIMNMFENDHSSLRGKMCMRQLIIFKHDTLLGNAPSHKLFDLVKIEKKEKDKVTRNYSDYDISISEDVPKGVTIIKK